MIDGTLNNGAGEKDQRENLSKISVKARLEEKQNQVSRTEPQTQSTLHKTVMER